MSPAVAAFLQWVHDTWLGQVTRDISWLFTAGLVIHFTGLCLLMGAMLVVDLRLLGFARQMPVKAALGLLPWALIGFGLNLATGIMFFSFDPFAYWQNPAFKIKLVLIVLAGLNALWFTVTEQSHVTAVGPGESTSLATRTSATLSLGLWLLIILAGRLIVAFQGSPDLFK